MLEKICQSYIDNDGSIKDGDKITTFVDTVPNGVEPLQEITSKLTNAKILIMIRDSVSLTYSNAKRIVSYQEGWDEKLLRRLMFTQDQFMRRYLYYALSN